MAHAKRKEDTKSQDSPSPDENKRLLDELETIYNQFLLLKRETDVSYSQLRDRNKSLERKVGELEEANRARENAENQLIHSERLAAMGQLAASIVHELSNPLTVISGYIELLLMRPSLTGEETRLLSVARQHSETMTNLVRDILSFSHKHSSPFGIVDTNETVEYVVSFLKTLMRKKTMSVKMSLGRDLPSTIGSVQQIQQVLINLITNASDAMTDHGNMTIVTDQMDGAQVLEMLQDPKTQSARSESDVQALCEEYESFLAVHCVDDGPGISPDILENVFNPFFTTKPAGEGTGLGLSISRTIIERHNGNLMASSEEGQGTTFSVLLPVRSAQSVILDESRARE
ncbi:MAG: hypothetical protein HOH43_22845 [Candidatus Latescibacteria bacterium]|jgi:signal transduction histidine kinase|nr:hypothetical protein [Candidatus Latescibacterota bacterium]